MKFSDQELFYWMVEPDGLLRWHSSDDFKLDRTAYTQPYRNPGCPSCSPEFIKNIRHFCPQWLYFRFRYAALHYQTFFSQIWPQFMDIANDLIYLEWMLYVEPMNIKYRDHLLHMFKVARVGDFLLHQKLGGKEISEIMQEKIFTAQHVAEWLEQERLPAFDCKKRKKIILWAFILAALFHDFGYGFYHRNTLDNRLTRINQWLPSFSCNSDMSILTQELLSHSLIAHFLHMHTSEGKYAIQDKKMHRSISGIARNELTMNHSMASALFVLNLEHELNVKHCLTDDWHIALQLAAEAIMLHDMTSEEKCCCNDIISSNLQEQSPLSALLILCDELSLWARPRLEGSPSSNKYKCMLKLKIKTKEIDINITPNPSSINILLRPSDTFEANKLRETLVGVKVFNHSSKLSLFGADIIL